MTTEAELQLVISASNDRVLAALGSFERSLNAIERAHNTASQAANQHTLQLGNLGNSLQKLVNLGTAFAVFEAFKTGLQALDGLEQRNIALLRTTEILGGNATAASTWSVAANEMGISLDVIDKGFAKLSTALNSTGNPALKQMGIAAEDTNGKIRPLNDVINQAANYFQAHAGAVNNAALANALFGRSGYELLPILEQGQGGLAAITEEARKYGLILDSTTIERNAAFTFQLKEAQLAAEGLASSVGNAVLPGVAALGQAFSKMVSDNLPAFVAGVNRAVSYLIGMVEAFTGLSLAVDQGATSLSSLANITGDTGSAMDSTAGSAGALADAEQRVRDQAKDATAAIDDQVRALNAQTAASQFADTQTKLQEDIANKGKDILKLQHEQYTDYWLGNFVTAANVGQQITQAQEDAADLQKQLATNTVNEQTKTQIAGLEEQKRSIQSAADDQIQAMQKAARGTTAAMGGAVAAIPPLFSAAGQAAASNFKFAMDAGAEATGVSMGKKLQDALLGPEIGVDSDRKIAGHFERKGGEGFVQIGNAIGDAIATGITTSLGNSFSNWWNHSFVPGIQRAVTPGVFGGTGGAFDPTLFAHRSGGLQFDRGGMVPGYIGQPQFAIVHGGEEVRTPAQQAAGTDMSRVERLLEQLVAIAGSGSAPGWLSDIQNGVGAARMSRARGIVGA